MVTINSSGNTTSIVPSINAITSSLCVGGSVELVAMPSINGATYIWFKDGLTVAATESRFYLATEAGRYTVAIQDGECISAESTTYVDVTLSGGTAEDKPYITAPSHDLCVGLDLVLTANTDADPNTITGYKWYEAATNNILGTAKTLRVTQAGRYTVVVETSGCSTVASDVWEVQESEDENCLTSHIILSVSATEVNEGGSVNIIATLADGYIANSEMPISLSFAGMAEQGNCVVGSGHGDFQLTVANPSQPQIIIPQGASTAFVVMTTCVDSIYEGFENVVINATYLDKPISQSPQEVTIIDGEANADGTLTLAWKLEDTGNTPSNMVYKGETAYYTLTALHPDGVTPITVQNDEQVAISYTPGTAPTIDGTHYRSVATATIGAGTSSVMVEIETIDDNIVERDDRELITDMSVGSVVNFIAPYRSARLNGYYNTLPCDFLYI